MEEYSVEEQQKLKEFFAACNEMIDGRFILSDVKVAKILKAIAGCKTLYDLFAKCLLNFNFDREFKNAKTTSKINGGYFVLPSEEKKIIAMVFCFLLDVDNKKINLQNFINENFYNPDGYNISYSNFAMNVLIPFKNSVLNELNCNENGVVVDSNVEDEEVEDEEETEEETETQVSEDNTRELNILFANLRIALNELYSATKRQARLKEDLFDELKIIMNAFHEAINIRNLKIINALMIPLEYILKKQKSLRYYYQKVKECLIEFYYED